MKKLLNSLLVVFLLWGNVGVYAESVSDDNALDGSTAEVITDNQELGATTEEVNSEETTEQSEGEKVFVDETVSEEPASENTVESLDNENLSNEPSFEESTTTETSEETETPIEIEETEYVDLLNEGEEHQDFTLSIIYFNSRVDNGRTALNHNTPAILDLDTLSGTLTLQMNYEGNTLSKNYAPGEFTFKVYGLEKFGLKSPDKENIMLVKDLIAIMDADLKQDVELDVYNATADLIADRLLEENNHTYRSTDLLNRFRDGSLAEITKDDPVALLASQIVINSRVKSLSKLLTEGSLNILDGLDVEYISKSDNGGIKITIKEV